MPYLHICSFCKKTAIEARAIIAGPSVNICAECVDFCTIILIQTGFMNKVWRDKYRYMWE
jgi:ATP-dependent protease Clp ATPase subunit